jgi:hypothetical protein
MTNEVDVRENYILKIDHELLSLLLFDHTTINNIFWATDNYYIKLGKGFRPDDEITVERVTGEYCNLVKPRVKKTKAEQTARVRDKAEVFTPSWICNSQNNLIDERRKNAKFYN